MHPTSTGPRFPFPELIRRFMAMEAASGLVTLLAAAGALLMANSGWSPLYTAMTEASLSFALNGHQAVEPIKYWINDILMVFFFLLVGMELKREAVEGFLARRDQIRLPALAALGGMVLPALLFLAVNTHHPENWRGWAIPTATDIAFAVCILQLAARSMPPAAKIFLLAIAIFDDLGAILIIAFFYSHGLDISALALAGLGVAALYFLNQRQVSVLAPYWIVGVYLWFCLYHAGIHTTIAGVLVGLALPMRCPRRHDYSPINIAMEFLHPWVGFVILPVFAFANAGLDLRGIDAASILHPLPWGIALGMFVGKPLGIFMTSWATIKLQWAERPQGAGWRHMYGISVVAGIGFTMSLFIGILAFPEAQQSEVKIGVMAGSLLSMLWGTWVLRGATERKSL